MTLSFAPERVEQWPLARLQPYARYAKTHGADQVAFAVLTDAPGNLIDFRLLPGQAHDLRRTAVLIEGLTCGQLLADRAFDANWLRYVLAAAGIVAVIPPKPNRRFPATFDRHTCKWRHLIENFFQKFKEYRSIAMRCCKTDTSCAALVALAVTIIRLN